MALTEVLVRDIRANGPGISARTTPGCPRDIRPENFLLSCFFVPERSKKKRTPPPPPPKENLLETFSGLKEELSRPVVDTKPDKNRENHIYHPEIFPLWPPFFSAKKSSSLEQGGVCFLFPSTLRFYDWDFLEKIPAKIRTDPGNALRAFPGIPLESTAGIPQALQFKPLEGSRAFETISRIRSLPPQYGWGRLFFQKWFWRGPLGAGHGIPAVLGAFLNLAFLHWEALDVHFANVHFSF